MSWLAYIIPYSEHTIILTIDHSDKRPMHAP